MMVLNNLQIVLPDVDPLPLPAPPILFIALLFLTFTLHMIAMNFTLGGSIIQTIASFSKNEQLRKFSGFLSKSLPITLSFTVTMGVAPLLFIQVLYGQIFFTTSVLMGWIWLFMLVCLLLAYYGLYYYQMKSETSAFARKWIPPIAMILFLFIALVFIMNFRLFFVPELWKEIADSGAAGFYMNISHPTVWPNMFHYVASAIAYVGLLIVIHGWIKKRDDSDYASWAVRFGGMLFIVPTALQYLIGSWILIALPEKVMKAFMFSDMYGTVIMFAGMGLTLVSILFMIWSVVKRTFGFPVIMVLLTSLLTLALMTMIRAYARDMMISSYFDMDAFKVVPQWDTIIIFAVLLVAGLGIVGWMLYHVAVGKGKEESVV